MLEEKTNKSEVKESNYKLAKIVIIGLGLIATGIGGALIEQRLNKVQERENEEYRRIFLKESNIQLPTKKDSINFYFENGLESYMIYENPLDTTKSFEEHIRLLDVSNTQIKRIVKEYKE